MKKNSLIKFVGLIILLMTFQISFAQNRGKPKAPKALEIEMTIDWDQWSKDEWYDAVTFKDNNQGSSPGKGRSQVSKVRRNQKVIWKTKKKNWPNSAKDTVAEVILINVTRNPQEGGKFLLTNSWYFSQDNGATIEGQTRRSFENEDEERYIISFAIRYENKDDSDSNDVRYRYDIYTIDPILKGHE